MIAQFDIFMITGAPAPDGNGTLTLPNAPAINAVGRLSFVSQLTGTTGGSTDNSGIFVYDSDDLIQIARKGDPLIGRTISFPLSSNIDAAGNVSGVASLSDGLIWYLLGDGGSLTSPFTLGSPSPSGNNTLLGVATRAVNDMGVTAFRAVFNGPNPEVGIYLRAPDGGITTLLKQQSQAPRGGTITNAANRLTINESSQVASLLSINNSIGSIARVDSLGVVELAREGDVLSDGVTTITEISSDSSFSLDPIPLINDAGQVAFPAQYTQPASRFGVFLADDSGVRLLTPPNLPGAPGFATTLEATGVSNAGEVTVFAEFGFGGDPVSGIYLAEESGVDLVAIEDTATPVAGKFFRSFFKSAIATNAAGQIAFLAELSDTANGAAAGRGLFSYDSASGLQQVIRTGDSLDGSVVTDLFFNGTLFSAISNQSPDTNGSGLNADGKVAFAFDLASGTSGLATWYPQIVDVFGDFDNDGDADGRDFLIWQRGESPVPLSASDLQSWQDNYGGGNPASLSIPEPPAVALVCCTVLLAARRRITPASQER